MKNVFVLYTAKYGESTEFKAIRHIPEPSLFEVLTPEESAFQDHESVWRYCQNFDGSSYSKLGMRSLMPGDVVIIDGVAKSIQGMGFQDFSLSNKIESDIWNISLPSPGTPAFKYGVEVGVLMSQREGDVEGFIVGIYWQVLSPVNEPLICNVAFYKGFQGTSGGHSMVSASFETVQSLFYDGCRFQYNTEYDTARFFKFNRND